MTPMNPSNLPNCTIIGGGVIGLTLAYELAGRGFAVTVLDQNQPGSGSSWAGAGILAACSALTEDPFEKLRGISHKLFPEFSEELHRLTGIDNGYRRCGGLYLARSAAENATLAAQSIDWEEQKISATRLSIEQSLELEPALRPLIDNGNVRSLWLLPDECQVRNPWHLRALVAGCQMRGVSILDNHAVDRIVLTADGKYALTTPRGTRLAQHVCICSGAWTRLVLDAMEVPNGILPVRGQMVLYHTQRPLIRHIINEGHRYLVPREDGRLLAGSCEEEAGFQITTTEPKIQELRQWAETILPQLGSAQIEKTWAGLRPGSFDSLPYLGAVPGKPKLFVAAGHYRSGIHLSCATAKVMADLICEQPPLLDLTAFRVGRG